MMINQQRNVLVGSFLATLGAWCWACAATTGAEPRPLDEALASIKVKPEFVVELAAAEPLIADPVAIDFGPDGRLWVADMTDYGQYVHDEFEQTGSVRVLADRDGDGRYDESKVFQGGLRFPTDVKAWRRGVIVCDAPNVLYLEDQDGDGRADVRKVLLTGFATANAQARVNSLRWGLDNWLYGSCGLLGGKVRTFTGQEADISRDFRFRPDTGELEPVTGSTQQGRARDDWGNWFGCDNTVLLRHYPLVDHYLARNPHIAPPPTDVLVPTGDDPDVLYPIGEPTIYTLSGPPGRPTAACGLDFYRDELLGPDYANNAFVAEPVNQLVHREVLTPNGSTFAGRRAADEADREFLASTDPWFRPVQIRTGLDGCVYVVDMHREIIEHQKFVPEEVLEHANLFGGRDEGRIYRIRRRDAPARAVPRLDKLDDAALVATLESPNGPQRDLAQQMLIDRAAKAAAPQLREMVRSEQRPAARLQALCTLEGLGQLDAETVTIALHDQDGAVRRHAIRVGESLSDHAPIRDAMLALSRDVDPQVRVQLAYSLGELNDPRAAEVLAQLAISDADDAYVRAAVWSSVNARNVGAVAAALFAAESELPEAVLDAAIELAVALGAEEDALGAARTLVASTPFEPWQWDAAALLLTKSRQSKRDVTSLLHVLAPMTTAAAQALAESAENPEQALPALRLLVAGGGSAETLPVVTLLLGPQNSPEVQQAAVELIAAMGAPEAVAELLAAWPGLSTVVRAPAFDVVLGKREFTLQLLDALEEGVLTGVQLDAFQRQRLLTHADEAIRTAAARLLAADGKSSRAAIVERYLAQSEPAGDVDRGRAAFAKHCSTCHRLEGQGNEVGPDLAALSSRTRTSLVESILDPNRAVDDRFRSFTALTAEGLSHAGLLMAETSTSITLVDQVAKSHVILRTDLDSLEASGVSLMPEGFEQELSPAAVNDVVAYLMTFGGATVESPKGTTPLLATADDDGILWLRAVNSEITGGDIRYEPDRQNIGYWIYESDRVAWKVEVAQAGEYDVYLEWSCAPRDAGSRFVLEGGAEPLEGAVGATSGVDEFRIGPIGSIKLPAGASRLVMRCLGPPKRRHLMDLRGVYLVPADTRPDRVLIGKRGDDDDPAGSIAALLEGLAVGTPVEYDRIPAIWQHAKAAGRRNGDDQLSTLLEFSVPALDAPLTDWQAVVIGGGIINGLSEAGEWPQQRLEELVGRNPDLAARWDRLDELALAMAENVDVPTGTRYDALRILAAFSWDEWKDTLCSYLGKDVHAELQMGAVSSLVDFNVPEAAEELVAAFVSLEESNRRLAIEGLLRTEERRLLLAKCILDGTIAREELTQDELDQLEAAIRSLQR